MVGVVKGDMLARGSLGVLVWIALSAWVGEMVFGVWVGVKVGESDMD